MFAANFGYNEEYVDNKLDMDRFFCHIDYLHENPPAGGVIKKVVEAYCEGAKKSNKGHKTTSTSCDSYESSNDGGQQRPKNWDKLSKEQQFAWESQQLEALKAIFGMSGGIVRKGQKGG